MKDLLKGKGYPVTWAPKGGNAMEGGNAMAGAALAGMLAFVCFFLIFVCWGLFVGRCIAYSVGRPWSGSIVGAAGSLLGGWLGSTVGRTDPPHDGYELISLSIGAFVGAFLLPLVIFYFTPAKPR
jgi:hypothetical protein